MGHMCAQRSNIRSTKPTTNQVMQHNRSPERAAHFAGASSYLKEQRKVQPQEPLAAVGPVAAGSPKPAGDKAPGPPLGSPGSVTEGFPDELPSPLRI